MENMELNEYQKKAMETAVYPEQYKIIYSALGLSEEAGEVTGKVKKWLRGDDGVGLISDERKEAIKLEMGDVLWYLAALSKDLGFSLGDVADANIQKLKSRKERDALKGNGDNR